MGARDYCFTAWGDEPEWDESGLKYLIWGRELCPSTDRQHYQGFAIFKSTCRVPKAKRILGVGDGSHFESRRGTRQQAADYCRKGGDVSEFGTLDPITKEDLFKWPIPKLKEEYPAFYCRYHSGLEKLASKGPKWRDVKVYIIHGKAGSGKTRHVMELKEEIFKIDPPYKWWNGYEGEEVLLIDDYEDGVLPRGTLMNLLDGYRMRLEVKGSHTWALWNTVYITTNQDPNLWMTDPSFKRRVTEIIDIDA